MHPAHDSEQMTFRCNHLDSGILTERICNTAVNISGLDFALPEALGSDTMGIHMAEALLVVNGREIAAFPISVESAAHAAGRLDRDRVQFPVPDKTVDAAFATMYLHHMNQPFQTILEIKRLLKPGGRIVLTDIEKHDFDFLTKEQYDRWQGFYFSDIRQWFSKAGFSNIIVGPVAKEKYLPPCRKNHAAFVTVFIATGTASHAALHENLKNRRGQ